MQISKRDPSELTVHPALKVMPDWGKEDPRYVALVEDIRERGIDQALQIDKQNHVIDGRLKLRAARQLQLAEVPVRVREDDEVFGVIVNSLIQRRHYTRSQLAYLTYPLMKDAFKEAHQRMLENLKKANNTRSTLNVLRAKTVEELAEQIGISRALFFQAQEVHQAFIKDQAKYEFHEEDGALVNLTLKEFFEGRILDPEKPAGLGAVIAGIAGMKATKGRPKMNPQQMELFGQAFGDLAVRWKRVVAHGPEEAREAVKTYVAGLPEDLCEVIESAIKARNLTQRRKGAEAQSR